MVKPVSRAYSQYSLTALEMLGLMVREARLAKGMTTTDLAARANISRALLHRIERGDPGCSIGVVFEVAAICEVALFEQPPQPLRAPLFRQTPASALLPTGRRATTLRVKDDF